MKYFSFKMPPLHYLLPFLALFPALFLVLHFVSKMQDLDFLEERLEILKKKSLSLAKEKAVHLDRNENITNSDRFYIDKHLESLTFLEPEIKNLQAQALQGVLNNLKNQRLDFLQSSNKLLFVEENTQRKGPLQEVIERQQHPIEINAEDLKTLLSRIEGISMHQYPSFPAGRPQLLIQNFELRKRETDTKEHVYVLNMQLIKREPIQ